LHAEAGYMAGESMPGKITRCIAGEVCNVERSSATKLERKDSETGFELSRRGYVRS
jgi:hypothetical protein